MAVQVLFVHYPYYFQQPLFLISSMQVYLIMTPIHGLSHVTHLLIKKSMISHYLPNLVHSGILVSPIYRLISFPRLSPSTHLYICISPQHHQAHSDPVSGLWIWKHIFSPYSVASTVIHLDSYSVLASSIFTC